MAALDENRENITNEALERKGTVLLVINVRMMFFAFSSSTILQ